MKDEPTKPDSVTPPISGPTGGSAASPEEVARLLHEAEQSRQVLLSLIEDQRAADAALRQTEERYRTLVETSMDWIWEMDLTYGLTYSSPRVHRLLGYRTDEVVGHTLFEFMPPEEARRLRSIARRIVAVADSFVALELDFLHRDGRTVVLEASGSPAFGADGALVGYRGMLRDVTERRAAERTLRLRGAALEAAANAIVITDRQGRIEWANRAFTALSGYTLDEAIGRSPGELVKSDRQDAAFFQHLWATILAGHVWNGEIVNRRKDGALRTEQMTITPLRDVQGGISHFIAIKQDITEQKLIEAKLRQTQRMEVIGTLAGGIAHDLNNILAPVLMVSGVLKQKLHDQADQNLLAMMEREAQRGAAIIRQLLTFSRGAEGERSLVQPRHVLRDIIHLMQETFPRDIQVSHEVPGQLWPVLADATQLHQVVLNLCVNARDAMPAGGRLVLDAANISLETGNPMLPEKAHAGPYVLIQVRDTGTGIAPEIQDRIFDPFFTTKPLGKGTGLGLSSVVAIVQRHGGFIGLESEVGQGSTFKVYLPATPEANALEPRAAGSASASGGSELILVVDDEENVREATRAVLERQGYRVLPAANGEDALIQFIGRRADVRLVLTDLMMPAMGGLALVKWLREIAPDLPILAMSGLEEDTPRHELAALGIADVLAKPFSAAKLLETVAARLRQPSFPGALDTR